MRARSSRQTAYPSRSTAGVAGDGDGGSVGRWRRGRRQGPAPVGLLELDCEVLLTPSTTSGWSCTPPPGSETSEKRNCCVLGPQPLTPNHPAAAEADPPWKLGRSAMSAPGSQPARAQEEPERGTA